MRINACPHDPNSTLSGDSQGNVTHSRLYEFVKPGAAHILATCSCPVAIGQYLPVYSLFKRLLFRHLDMFHADVGSYRKSVLDAAEEEDLIRQSSLFEDHL